MLELHFYNLCEKVVLDRDETTLLIQGTISMKGSDFLAILGEAKHFRTIEDSDENNGNTVMVVTLFPKGILIGFIIISWVVIICCYP